MKRIAVCNHGGAVGMIAAVRAWYDPRFTDLTVFGVNRGC
jgi:hypothetical protein